MTKQANTFYHHPELGIAHTEHAQSISKLPANWSPDSITRVDFSAFHADIGDERDNLWQVTQSTRTHHLWSATSLAVVCFGMLLPISLPTSLIEAAAPANPNILLLLADDLG